MAEKRTVYLTPETLALVRPGESLSGRLNDVCQRYAALRAILPDILMCLDEGRCTHDVVAAWKAIDD
jgi:hypothetical protein